MNYWPVFFVGTNVTDVVPVCNARSRLESGDGLYRPGSGAGRGERPTRPRPGAVYHHTIAEIRQILQ